MVSHTYEVDLIKATKSLTIKNLSILNLHYVWQDEPSNGAHAFTPKYR